MGACGPALPYNASYCSANDAIVWDCNLLQSQLIRFKNFAPVLIIAHEWGHMNQARNNLTFDPTRVRRQNELHADGQAGIFTAVEDAAGYLEPGDMLSAFASLYDAGDRAGPWFDPNGHGSCAERLNAFQHGYHNAKQRINEVCGPYYQAAMVSICRN